MITHRAIARFFRSGDSVEWIARVTQTSRRYVEHALRQAMIRRPARRKRWR